MSLRKLSDTAFTKLAEPGAGATITNTGKCPVIVQSAGRSFTLPPEARFSAMSGGDGDGVFAKATAPGGEVLAEVAPVRYGVPT